MVIRVWRWIVGWIAGFVGTLTVLAAVFSWTLASSGIDVDALIPYVERALEPADGTFAVEVDAARLHWNGWDRRAPNIRVEGVRVKGRDGEVATVLPELVVTFSPRALAFHGALAPVRVDIIAPTVLLVRDEDGAIGLRGIGAADAADPGEEEGFAELARAAVARLLDTADDPDEPLAHLSELRVVGGRLLFDDRVTGLSLAASDAEVVVARAPTGLAGWVDVALEQEGAGSAAAVRATYRYQADGGSTDLRVEFGNLDPTGFAALAPEVLPIDRLDLSVDGRLRFTIGAGGRVSAIAFELSAADAALLPTEALPQGLALERVRARGRLDAAAASLRLDELGASSGDGTNLRARAAFDWSEAPFAAWAEVGVDRLRAEQLERYWPPRLEPKAREWVLGNITAGGAHDGHVELRLTAADLAQRRLSPDALNGRFRFADVAVRYLEGLPPATGVAGEARFTADRMDFTIGRGRVGRLRAQGATVALVELTRKDAERVVVTVDAEGQVPDALALIDRPPLGFAGKLGVDPALTSGRVRADLRLEFPLAPRIEPDMIAVAVEADVGGAAVRGIANGIDLSDGALRLRADNRALDLEGRAVLGGVPVALHWHENLTDRGPKRRYGATGRLDVSAALAGRSGDRLLDYVWGRPAFDVRVVQPRAGPPRAGVTVDLADAGLRIEALDWRKPEGAPGRLSLMAEVAGTGAVEVTELKLSAAGLEAKGSLRLAAGSLRPVAVDLARLAVGGTTTAARWRPIGDGHDLELSGGTLDLRPLVAAWREQRPPDEGDGVAASRLRIALRVDRVLLPGGALSRVEGRLTRDAAAVWRNAELRGHLEGSAAARAWLAPNGGRGHRLTVVTDDAGNLLRLAGVTTAIQGGDLTLTVELDAQVPDRVGGGVLGIGDFMVAEAPALAKLLTLASMTGIANLLQGRGIAFDVLELPFRFGPEGIRIVDGRASGSQIGLTVEGTVSDDGGLDLGGTIVPLYGLNRALGQVPIIGALLAGGGGGDGVFAATYGVRGTRDDPVFSVNPLAVLAPGIVRKLVQGIADGTLEPPAIETSPRDR